jgi:hypothetical protein
MITSAIPTKPLDTFTLELPKGDTAFLKTLARKMGWTVRSNRRKMSSYERSLRDLDEGRVYEYDSLDDLIKEIEG